MKVLCITKYLSPYRADFFNELGKYIDLDVVLEQNIEKQKHRNPQWFNNSIESFSVIPIKGFSLLGKVINPGIVNLIAKKNYDIVLVHGYASLTEIISILSLRIFKIPFFIQIDGVLYSEEKKIKDLIKKKLFKGNTKFIVTGNHTKEYLEKFSVDTKRIYFCPFSSLRDTEVLANSLSPEQKKKIRNDLKIIEDKVIVSVGQFIHGKGFDVLMNACKNIDSSVGVYIIGGKPTAEYIDLKEKLKLKNVKFVDFKKKNELIEYYKLADLFVFPTRGDVWGLVVNEAMAQGLPVVTTDKCVAGLDLIEDDVNGYIVPVNNSTIMSEKINYILSNQRVREKMAENNLTKIKRYTIEEMVKKHLVIFNESLKNES